MGVPTEGEPVADEPVSAAAAGNDPGTVARSESAGDEGVGLGGSVGTLGASTSAGQKESEKQRGVPRGARPGYPFSEDGHATIGPS